MRQQEIQDNLVSKDKLKDVLITRTAIKTLQEPSVVEKIINFTYKNAAAAFRTEREIEISGFGVFKVRDNTIDKCIEKKTRQMSGYQKELDNQIDDPLKKQANETISEIIQTLKNDILNLNIKKVKPIE